MFCCSWTTYLEQLACQSARQGSQLHIIQKTMFQTDCSASWLFWLLRLINTITYLLICLLAYLLAYLLTYLLTYIFTEILLYAVQFKCETFCTFCYAVTLLFIPGDTTSETVTLMEDCLMVLGSLLSNRFEQKMLSFTFRTSVFDRRTFPVLRSTCSWRVTTYTGKLSVVGQSTRLTEK